MRTATHRACWQREFVDLAIGHRRVLLALTDKPISLAPPPNPARAGIHRLQQRPAGGPAGLLHSSSAGRSTRLLACGVMYRTPAGDTVSA